MGAKCDKCNNVRSVLVSSYKRNILKNSGKYVCQDCKIGRKFPTVTFVCEYCKMEKIISGAKYRKHKNPPRFCSLQCSKISQKLHYQKLQENGKKCSMCKLVKPIENFGSATGIIKSPGKKESYCKDCNNKYRSIWSNRLKMKAVKYLGGKCKQCGILAGKDLHPVCFDFHHRDPTQKEFTISKIHKTWEKVVIELDKCDLLCAYCHRLEHINLDLWDDYSALNLTSS